MRKIMEITITEEDAVSTGIQDVVGLSSAKATAIHSDVEARFKTGDNLDKILRDVLNTYDGSELAFSCICFGYMQYHNHQLAKMMGLA